MPLWFVADMLNTPWQPTTSRSCSRASRARAKRLGAGFRDLEVTGIARSRRIALSRVLAPVAGAPPSCFGTQRYSLRHPCSDSNRRFRRSRASVPRPAPCPRPCPCQREIVGRDRVRLIDRPLEALVAERRLRQLRGPPTAAISIASGLAAIILSVYPVTLWSVRLNRSTAMTLIPAFSASPRTP
jgi:hypothetical protein